MGLGREFWPPSRPAVHCWSGGITATAPTPDLTLRWVRGCERWWGMAEELNKSPQVLCGCSEQDLVPDATQAPQSKPVEPEDTLHVRKPHLDFLALAVRLLEGFCVGQCAEAVTHILIEIAGELIRSAVPLHLQNSRALTLAFIAPTSVDKIGRLVTILDTLPTLWALNVQAIN